MDQLQIRGHRVVQLQAIGEKFPPIRSLGPDQQVLQGLRGARGFIVEQDDPSPRRTRRAHHHVVIGTGRLLAAHHLQIGLIHLHQRIGQQLFVQQMTIYAKSYLRDLRRDAVVETR